MRITCVSTQYPGSDREDYSDDLVVGTDYVAYGITIRKGDFWYYICDKSFLYYPIWRPGSLFRIADPRLSRLWILGGGPDCPPIISFPEWVNDLQYYNRLTDGDPDAMAVFANYKRLMDLEYALPSVAIAAQKAWDDWVLCGVCLEAWVPDNQVDEMLCCPKCRTVQHRP